MYFPQSPADGDTYENNGVTYIYDATNNVWNAVAGQAPGEGYTKAEADNRFVNVTGDAMTGNLSMGNNAIQNLKDPVGAYDAANLHTVEEETEKKVDKKGDTMTGVLSMSNHAIENVSTPSNPTDAVNKQYVDDADAALDNKKVNKAGDTMDGNLFLVDGAGSPLVITAAGHATTKEYVDDAIANSVSNPIHYLGKIDASLSGPTKTPATNGDLYIHENYDGSGDAVTPDAAWGLNEDINDLDRLLYDGTNWAIIHTAGNYVSKKGGDSMEGPLVVTTASGTGARETSKVSTYGVYSPNTSNLQLGVNAGAGGQGIGLTKVYVGETNVDFLVPIKVNNLEPRSNNVGIKYDGIITDPKHLVNKELLDDYFDNIIGEFTYKYLGASESAGFLVDFKNSAPADPQDVTWFALVEEDKHGVPLEDDDFFVGKYIHLQTAKGDAYYKVTEAYWSGASALLTKPGWELKLEWIVGDGFKFTQDDEVLIQSGNIAALTELFVSSDSPEFTGEITLKETKIVSDFRESPDAEVTLFHHRPTLVPGSDPTKAKNHHARFIFANTSGINTTSIDLEGFTSSNRLKIRGRSNGKQDLIQINADATIRFFENINLMPGGVDGSTQPRITGLGDPVDDGDAVSLGYITEALQDKFEELIGQSAQGNYLHSITVAPPSGKFSAFNSNANLITDGIYDPRDIEKFTFHTTDNNNHTVDFSGLSVGDYLVLIIQTVISRFRVEQVPVPQHGQPLVDIVVSHISGGDPNTDYFNEAALQFQKISGSVDLDDYVKKAGDKMSGTLSIEIESGPFFDLKQINSSGAATGKYIKANANGTLELNNNIALDANLHFQSNNQNIKLSNTNKIQFSNANTGGTVIVPHQGNAKTGFALKGRISTNTGSTSGDVFNIYHAPTSSTPDGAYYRGSKESPDNLANQEDISKLLPLDGSEKMTGNLTVETTSESKTILIGSKNNTTQSFGTVEFQNKSGYADPDYLLCLGNTAASRKFRFSAPVTFARNKGGDGVDSVIIEGRVGDTTDTKGRLLSTHTNSGADEGDAVNYYGKISGANNIQTKKSVEDLFKSAFPYKITESGGQFFIEAN
jgi:hypothetical protein